MKPMQLSDAEYFFKLDNMVLTSCHVLRKVFQARWKKESGKDWEHTERQGKIFIRGLGNDAFNKADAIQKSILAKGCLDDWDLTALSLVILNLGEWRSYEAENKAVRRLKDLRNGLAHHGTRKICEQDYRGKVAVFRKSLKELKARDEEIEEMITNAGISCSNAAFRMGKKLYDKARKKMAQNNFEKAIELCSEAIALPSLIPLHLGLTYENRADCYLKFGEYRRRNQERSKGGLYIDQAIQDATKALEFNENSWKAHFLIGRCHKLHNNLKLAIKHLTSASTISPTQKQVKSELDGCKADYKMQCSDDQFHPDLVPSTLRERCADRQEVTGRKITQKEYLRNWKRMEIIRGAVYPGENDVMRGIAYKSGLGVKPNDEEAAKCFAKAAELDHPEGMLELAECYFDGIGLQRNPSKGYELCLKAAQMPTNTLGRRNLADKNSGIASAQFKLGTLYEHGIVVEKDHFESVKWYKRAADNGNAFASTNVAAHYMEGKGAARNEKMAEMYWYQALLLKDSYAAYSLVNYYLDSLEPEKAEALFKTARSLDRLVFKKKSDQEFQSDLEKVKLEREKRNADIMAFEKERKLSTKGLTFMERYKRKLHFSDGSEPRIVKLKRLALEKVEQYKLKVMANNEDEEYEQTEVNVKFMHSKVKEGSVTAAAILETLAISRRLINFVDGKEAFRDKQKIQVLNMLYECAIREFDVVCFKKTTKAKLKSLVEELYEGKRGKKDEDEMKIRFVYVKLNYPSGSGDGSFPAALLKQGIRMYPENFHYYVLLCEYERDPEAGLAFAKKGLEKAPDNPNLLFALAFFLRYALLPICSCCKLHVETDAPKKKKAVIEAYLNYLSKAAPDDKHIPEAYYGCAMVHQTISADLKKMKKYFKLGQEAEKKMLPCYSPNCCDRLFIETLISLMKSDDDTGLQTEVSSSTEGVSGILERRMYLDSPVRRWIVTDHRRKINGVSRKKLVLCSAIELGKHGLGYIPKQKLVQKVPERMCDVKPITLMEMNPITNHVYEDRVIDLTIIDVPLVHCYCQAIHFIAEDEDGNVTRLNVYNREKDKKYNLEELQLGAKIAILSPYMETGAEPTENGIRNDDPDCIIYLGKVDNMCSFCGDPNAVQKCGKCRKSVYCSKECQEHDWRVLKHKLICSTDLSITKS